jgi:hypothetical protein
VRPIPHRRKNFLDSPVPLTYFLYRIPFADKSRGENVPASPKSLKAVADALSFRRVVTPH